MRKIWKHVHLKFMYDAYIYICLADFEGWHYGSKWFKSGQNLKNMKVFNIYFFMHFWWEEFLYFQDLQFSLMKLSFSHCKSWFNLKNICIIKHIWKTKDLWVYRKLFTTPSFLFLGTKYLVHKLFLHSSMQKNYKNIYTFKINGKKWLFLP